MDREFEDLIKRLTPTLRRIAHKLNGRFSFFDDDDLFQEALAHLWIAFKQGKVGDKTDSYILQGCYYHLRNHLRKIVDGVSLISLNEIFYEDGDTLEESLSTEDPNITNSVEDELIKEGAKTSGLSDREEKVLKLLLEGSTLREIGKLIGVSHTMVVKIKRKIKNKLADFKRMSIAGYQN